MITVALYKQITCMIPDIQILNVLFRYLLLNNLVLMLQTYMRKQLAGSLRI